MNLWLRGKKFRRGALLRGTFAGGGMSKFLACDGTPLHPPSEENPEKGGNKHCFSLAMFGICSSNAIYSGNLSFILLAFLLALFDS